MNDKNCTEELKKIAEKYEQLYELSLADFAVFCKNQLSAPLPSISGFLYDYIIKHDLSTAEIIKNS